MCQRPTYFNPNLIHVPTPQLWDWIDCEVLENINSQKTFTAYGITKALRAQHPKHEITHYYVQARVHYLMECVNHYALSWEIWDGEPARTYAPVCATVPVPPFSFGKKKKRGKKAVRIDWGNPEPI